MKETNEINPESASEELTNLKGALRQAIDDGDLQKAGELKKMILPQLEVVRQGVGVTPEKAKEIFGDNYFGPEAIEKAYKIKPEKIPKIPFTGEDLEQAKENGDILVLRVDKDSEGQPLTMERIEELVSKDGTSAARKADQWWATEKIFNYGIPRPGWALISGSLMIATAGENYLAQTEILVASFVANNLGKDMPPEYQEALEELERKAPILKVRQHIAENNEVSKEVTGLKINQLLRHTPVEAFYDTFLHYLNKTDGRGLYNFNNIWTNQFIPGKGIVAVGANGVQCKNALEESSHPFFAVISRRS